MIRVHFLLYTLVIIMVASSLGYTQTKLTQEELMADAAILKSALDNLHPSILLHQSEDRYAENYAVFTKELTQVKTKEAAFLCFSRYINTIKCGHTYLNPFNQRDTLIDSLLQENTLLPFGFTIQEEGLRINQSMVKDLKEEGDIIQINDIDVTTLCETILPYIKTDGNNLAKKVYDLSLDVESRYSYFDIYSALLFNWQDSVTVTFTSGNTARIALVTKNQRDEALQQKGNNYDNLWHHSFEDDYALLRLGTFVTWKMTIDWQAYLDDFFDEFHERGLENLIIDIQGNEGGSDVSPYLLKKIANKKGLFVKRSRTMAYTQVPDPLKPFLNTWSKWPYHPRLLTKRSKNGQRELRWLGRKKIIRKNKKAPKQTYLLVDAANSSNTFFLAENCKKNQYATLVGTETGGSLRGITGGQLFFLSLPNSKIVVDIPLIGFHNVEEKDQGVLPDIVIESKGSETNWALDKVVEIIR